MKPDDQLEVETVSAVYTYPGNHAHAVGTRLKLPREHALALVDGGHATHVVDKPAAAVGDPPAEPEQALALSDDSHAAPADESLPAAVEAPAAGPE